MRPANAQVHRESRHALGREGPATLLRRPSVQALLGVVAALQLVAVASPDGAPLEVVALPAAVVSPATPVKAGGGVAAAWERAAVARESERIAAAYRAEGYPVTQSLAREIHEAAVEQGIDPEIAFGLVRAESSFRNTATSPVGAVGLTQLMPKTASWMEPGVSRAQLRSPETNLRIGFKYLRYLLDRYDGNENLALLAYNRGPGTVDRTLKRGGNPDNGYADFVRGRPNDHRLFTR